MEVWRGWFVVTCYFKGVCMSYAAMAPNPIRCGHAPERMAGVTFCHLTGFDDAERMRGVLERVRAIPVDLLFVTGRQVKGGLSAGMGACHRAVDELEYALDIVQPRFGAYGVCSADDPSMWCAAVKGLNVNWLNNETVVHSALPFTVCGVSERVGRGGRGDLLGAHLNGAVKSALKRVGVLLLPSEMYLRYGQYVPHGLCFTGGRVEPWVKGNVCSGVSVDEWKPWAGKHNGLPVFMIECAGEVAMETGSG